MVCSGTRGGTGVVYDPLTGLTHRTGEPLLAGRTALAEEGIAALPEVHPGELRDVMPVSVCWSPIVRCNLACPHCLDDKSVPELGRGERAEVATRIASSGVLGVDVSGGEPLLIPDLPTLRNNLITRRTRRDARPPRHEHARVVNLHSRGTDPCGAVGKWPVTCGFGVRRTARFTRTSRPVPWNNARAVR